MLLPTSAPRSTPRRQPDRRWRSPEPVNGAPEPCVLGPDRPRQMRASWKKIAITSYAVFQQASVPYFLLDPEFVVVSWNSSSPFGRSPPNGPGWHSCQVVIAPAECPNFV